MNKRVEPTAIVSAVKPVQSWHAAEHDLLLQAAAALDRAGEYEDRLTDALRHFVELATEGLRTGPVEVQQKMASVLALMQSSDALSLTALKCALLAPQKASAVKTSAPSPIERFVTPLLGPVLAPKEASASENSGPSRIERPAAPLAAVLGSERASTMEISAPTTCERPTAPLITDGPKAKHHEQTHIKTILSEIETLLGSTVNGRTPTPPDCNLTDQTRKAVEQRDTDAGVGSQIDHERAASGDNLQLGLNERKVSNPVSQELEALLGKDAISVFSEAETFFANSIALDIKRRS